MIADGAKQISVATRAVFRDIGNKLKFGRQAPRVAELIWICPQQIERCIRILPPGISTGNCSAQVIDFADAGIVEEPLMRVAQYRSCYQHWCEGVAWEKTEDFQLLLSRIRNYGSSAGCRDEDELKRRFLKLDELFQAIAAAGSFKTQKELRLWNFRELGGVKIGINGALQPVLIRASGYHRIAIARILQLAVIPAQIGLVDIRAVEVLPRYRARLEPQEAAEAAAEQESQRHTLQP